jgi:hypothetical protein
LRAKSKTTKKKRLEEAAFFEAAPVAIDNDAVTFQEMNLSRPLLKVRFVFERLVDFSRSGGHVQWVSSSNTGPGCLHSRRIARQRYLCVRCYRNRYDTFLYFNFLCFHCNSLTFSGKTAAFMLPILERLLYKPKQKAVTRVLVLVPTRELAIQVFQVSRKLSQFTNVDISLSAGQ